MEQMLMLRTGNQSICEQKQVTIQSNNSQIPIQFTTFQA